ncbi:hypothetical protein [Hymenobacter latericus]|uniref:hypothetical protein n=1 Tax=Hymenobacter sp. YIM 151858-1 TaxID=2987688 RepID=UPI0022260DBE|nr:hypothetical protein [Hymenobacter sp. YIM 151858-1]UYZ60064.1 hypothetical protein OIS50_04510 [Hymenobacter sp. YIM 151858-1]
MQAPHADKVRTLARLNATNRDEPQRRQVLADLKQAGVLDSLGNWLNEDAQHLYITTCGAWLD